MSVLRRFWGSHICFFFLIRTLYPGLCENVLFQAFRPLLCVSHFHVCCSSSNLLPSFVSYFVNIGTTILLLLLPLAPLFLYFFFCVLLQDNNPFPTPFASSFVVSLPVDEWKGDPFPSLPLRVSRFLPHSARFSLITLSYVHDFVFLCYVCCFLDCLVLLGLSEFLLFLSLERKRVMSLEEWGFVVGFKK